MDELTLKTLQAFQEDGRVSFVEVAERLGVAEGTIRRKYAKLVESGILKIAGVVDPVATGYRAPAIIGVKVSVAKLQSVVAELTSIRRIRYVAATTGAYDIIIMAYLKDNEELFRLISQRIALIEGITSLETLVVLNTYKQSYDWLDPEAEDDI